MAEDKHPVFQACDFVADGIINGFFGILDPIFAEQIPQEKEKPEEAKASNPTMPPECQEVFGSGEDEEEVAKKQTDVVSEIGRAHCSNAEPHRPAMAARPRKKKDKAAKKKTKRNRRKNR